MGLGSFDPNGLYQMDPNWQPPQQMAPKPGLGQQVTQAMMTPQMQLAMQLLANSGWQKGNPSTGSRLGQAGLGFAQQQFEQQNRQAAIDEAKARGTAYAQQTAQQTELLKQRAEQQGRVTDALSKIKPDTPPDQAAAILLGSGDPELAKPAVDLLLKGKGPNSPYEGNDLRAQSMNIIAGEQAKPGSFTPDVLRMAFGQLEAPTIANGNIVASPFASDPGIQQMKKRMLNATTAGPVPPPPPGFK